MGGGEVEKAERLRMHAEGIPVFPTPQRAIRAIRDAVWVARNQTSQQEARFLGKTWFLDTNKETES
jgi:acyl-CoA synthetase (NDP forming)